VIDSFEYVFMSSGPDKWSSLRVKALGMKVGPKIEKYIKNPG
jgi:hypothetical protein